jgi:hypothetical protein
MICIALPSFPAKEAEGSRSLRRLRSRVHNPDRPKGKGSHRYGQPCFGQYPYQPTKLRVKVER